MEQQRLIGERLKNLRKSLGLSQQEFAVKLNVAHKSTISDYELGKEPIAQKALLVLFNDLLVNRDWLLNGDGEMFIHGEAPRTNKYFSKNLRAIREYWSLSQTELGLLMNASRGMVMQYEQRGSMPKEDIMQRLSIITGLEIEDLCEKELRREDLPELPDKFFQIITSYRRNPEEFDARALDELKLKIGKAREVVPLGKHAPLRLTADEYGAAFGDWPGLPIYNSPINASFIQNYRDEKIMHPMYYLHDPRFKDCDFGAVITGDSMHDEIRHGDIVICKEILDRRFIVFGDIYYVVAANGLETCKYINDGANRDEWLLVPKNKSVSPSPLPKDLLQKLYKVRGLIRGY